MTLIVQEDVGHGRSHNYNTNSIILIGLKVNDMADSKMAVIAKTVEHPSNMRLKSPPRFLRPTPEQHEV